jgi:hypothetical protein
MNNAQWNAQRHSAFASRRSLLAGALVLATRLGGTSGTAAKKKRKKRKHPRKQTCGVAGGPPVKGQCCAGAASIDGVCQACQVCATGCGFSAVQGAIDAASAGDTIVICPGTYVENITITKNVRLTGGIDASGTSLTTLRAARAASVVQVKTANVVLQRLRITGGRGEGGGISNLAATLEVIDCVVSENSDLGASGGGIYNAGILLLKGSSVSENEAALGGGIFNVDRNAIVVLTNSQIRGNRADNGGGIYTHEGGRVRIDAASRVTANAAKLEGGGIFASSTAGRIELASRDNVIANTPTNCGGSPVDFCSGI